MSIATFGLPECLRIPVAVANLGILEAQVGQIISRLTSRSGRIDALLVEAHPVPSPTAGVPLWSHGLAAEWRSRLHPQRQVWVHVDNNRYRSSWKKLGMPDPGAMFLDHICNRRAIRLRGSVHPYLRLCPVSSLVNTNAGGDFGGEGIEREFANNIQNYSQAIQETFRKANEAPMLLADPMDITKMLNVPPGTGTLDGVRDMQELFYPARNVMPRS